MIRTRRTRRRPDEGAAPKWRTVPPMDWGDGDYELTARVLEPLAQRVVEVAAPGPKERVIDVGAGTGNAALAAARRGAQVTAVEPAARLRKVMQARASAENLSVGILEGEASALPVPQAGFDVALSNFAVIFAPDADAAARELMRVVRPGGRILISAWVPQGAIAEVGTLLRRLVQRPDAPPGPAWGDPRFVSELFARHGAGGLDVREEVAVFESPSPAAWFAEQERHHPIWRGVRKLVDAAAWDGLRAQSVGVLTKANEGERHFQVTSRWLLYTVRVR